MVVPDGLVKGDAPGGVVISTGGVTVLVCV